MGSISSDLKALGDSVRPGQSLASAMTATRINAIIGLLRAFAAGKNLIAGYGLLKQAVAEGAMLSVLGGDGGSSSAGHPFRVTVAGSPKVKVTFGQVNSITPTINGEKLDATDTPLLTVATGVVYLAVVLNTTGAITSASIHNAAELPTADTTHGYLTLARVDVEGRKITAISQSVTHSLGHQKCGVRHNFWGV